MSAGDAFAALGIGLISGTYAGLLGVGGGIVMVPGMVLLLAVPQHVAEGTSLLVIIPTAVSAVAAYGRRGLVDLRVSAWLAAGGVGGAVAGALVALNAVPEEGTLRRIFGVFLLLAAARLAFGGRERSREGFGGPSEGSP